MIILFVSWIFILSLSPSLPFSVYISYDVSKFLETDLNIKHLSAWMESHTITTEARFIFFLHSLIMCKSTINKYRCCLFFWWKLLLMLFNWTGIHWMKRQWKNKIRIRHIIRIDFWALTNCAREREGERARANRYEGARKLSTPYQNHLAWIPWNSFHFFFCSIR